MPKSMVALLAVLFLAVGCSKDNPCRSMYAQETRSYEACLRTEKCVLTGKEMHDMLRYKQKHPHCFKEESR